MLTWLYRKLTKKSQDGQSNEDGLVKAAVYGANDGTITTFSVVAGVAGAGLSPSIVLILGVCNLLADGFSMGVGDYLGERSERDWQKRHHKEVTFRPVWLTGVVTFISFVIAGSLPLTPYFAGLLGFAIETRHQLFISVLATAATLFLVGVLRTLVTKGIWWRNGLEILGFGSIAAVVAYIIGALIQPLTNRGV